MSNNTSNVVNTGTCPGDWSKLIGKQLCSKDPIREQPAGGGGSNNKKDKGHLAIFPAA